MAGVASEDALSIRDAPRLEQTAARRVDHEQRSLRTGSDGGATGAVAAISAATGSIGGVTTTAIRWRAWRRVCPCNLRVSVALEDGDAHEGARLEEHHTT